ncbi:MAG TPA: YncE family protein, partial [Thermoanaerobaculia bacterium]|nr:YncE family protein [Thermoanaerobaculia bacterium]
MKLTPATLAVLLTASCTAIPPAGGPGPRAGGAIRLHDGWTIRPAGRAVVVGTFPMAIAPLPGARAAVLLCGFAEEGIDVVDLAHGTRRRLPMPKAWLGLAASSDGKTLYASGGADNVVRVFEERSGEWTETQPFQLGREGDAIFPAGIAIDESHERLYAAENLAGRVAELDLRSRKLLREYPVGNAPYEVRVDPAGGRLFVSNWGGGSVSEVLLDGSGTTRTWSAGSHPTALLFEPSSGRLLVACAGDDRVTALDVSSGAPVWNASMTLRAGDPEGTTPTSLVRAPDGRSLVACSNNNDLAVLDDRGERPRVDGFLPVGRYPTAVAVAGDTILVADGKGSVTRAAPDGPQPTDRIRGSRQPGYVLARQTG